MPSFPAWFPDARTSCQANQDAFSHPGQAVERDTVAALSWTPHPHPHPHPYSSVLHSSYALPVCASPCPLYPMCEHERPSNTPVTPVHMSSPGKRGERGDDMQQRAVSQNQTLATAKDSALVHGAHALPGELPGCPPSEPRLNCVSQYQQLFKLWLKFTWLEPESDSSHESDDFRLYLTKSKKTLTSRQMTRDFTWTLVF